MSWSIPAPEEAHKRANKSENQNMPNQCSIYVDFRQILSLSRINSCTEGRKERTMNFLMNSLFAFSYD